MTQEKEITIIVNTREKQVQKGDYSFAQIAALGFDTPPTGANVEFTITFRRGNGDKPEGSLIDGDTIKLKDGMIFNVRATDKS
jgi:hypothetical protein